MRYQGTIIKVTSTMLSVAVEVDKDACSACHVKSACEVGDKENKIIIVEEPHSLRYQVGSKITLEGKKKSELKAILLAYIVPFIIMFISLIITNLLYHIDGLSGMVALFTLVFYYGILYLCRNKIKNAFTFSIIEET